MRAPAGIAAAPAFARRQLGLSLIEVMVTIAISLILMAGLIELFVANKQGYRIQEGISRLNEDSRYAMTQIQHHLRMASHWGGGTSADFQGTAPVISGDCTFPAQSVALDYVQGLRAFEKSYLTTAPSLSCEAEASQLADDSHMLVTRFANSTQLRDATIIAQPNGIFVRSRIEHAARIFQIGSGFTMGAAFPVGSALGSSAATNRVYEQMVYYLRSCTDAGGDNRCGTSDDLDTDSQLRRLRMTGAAMEAEDIADGVEQFRLLFMLDATGAGDRIEYLSPDGVRFATAYGDDPWRAVRSAYVQMLIRVPEVDLSADDTTQYQFLSGAPYLPCGRDASNNQRDCNLRNYRRRLLTGLVQLRNHALGGAATQ